MINVQNMRSTSGAVANKFIITIPQGQIFQSYDSLIAFIPRSGKTVLGPHWDYSQTTGKYRNQFLGEDKKTTQAKIKSGEYLLVDDVGKYIENLAGSTVNGTTKGIAIAVSMMCRGFDTARILSECGIVSRKQLREVGTIEYHIENIGDLLPEG